ncbi:hypothetical protein HDIA_2024 [Hartmannibacter diazotrophicus]|uniref:Uncharacterized protein n=1 Tax=Hartmannibacter diazotrophicus TaxID=1482074 RepID=A0A2C9D7P8_9HYPH|nr:hypothetical protein [Hartmannibacter diazotrophicus]SON55565.1 hypothetical protein HDIA_2024 [Hartmannibacter diazotrophicus]
MHTALVTTACVAGLAFAVLGFAQSVSAQTPDSSGDVLAKSDPIANVAAHEADNYQTVETDHGNSNTSVLLRVMAKR